MQAFVGHCWITLLGVSGAIVSSWGDRSIVNEVISVRAPASMEKQGRG